MLTVRQILEVFNEYLTTDGKETSLLIADGNMMRVASKFIIRPVILINSDLRDNDKIKNIIEYNTNVFASFYSMVFKALVDLHGLEPKIAFNLLSSDSVDYLKGLEEYSVVGGLEEGTSLIAGCENKTPVKQDPISQVYTRHLTINISISGRSDSIAFPVVIYTTVKFIGSKSIANLYSKEDGQNPFDRADDMFAGAIEFWQDFIFARDLIREYKQRRLLDKDEVLKALRERQYSSKLKQLNTDYAGFSKLYQMLVLTNDDIKNIKSVYRKTLNHDKTRQKFLDDSLSFSATLIDELHEYITIYINGLENSVGLRYKDLSKTNRSEEQMEELLKILTSSRSI
jgi:hypothetical protein